MEKCDAKNYLDYLKSNSTATVYSSLVYIRTKYLQQQNGVLKLCLAGGVKLLIDLAEKSKLTDIVLSILGNCCTVECGRTEVIRHNGVATIVRIFRCLAAESIQNRACRTLANICLSKEGIATVEKESVFPHILNFLKTSTNTECQQTAMRAVRLIASGSSTASNKEKGITCASKFLDSENVDVLKASVKTVACLTHRCTIECAQRIQRSIPVLVELCVHRELDVVENALTSLVNLSYLPAIRPALGNAGAIPIFVKFVERKEETKPGFLAVVRALSLCCREVINHKRIQDSKGFQVLLDVLKNNDAKQVHGQVLASFLSFQYDEESMTAFLDCGLIPTLVEHLNAFIAKNRKDHPFKKTTDDYLCRPGRFHKHRQNIFQEAMMSFDGSYTTVKPLPDDNDENSETCFEAENEEDKEVAEMMAGLVTRKTVCGAKVFCIHSPSYQEVQNEANELPRLQDYTGKDLVYSDIHSPGSVISYCHSPDRSSNDWSIPASPDRSSVCSPSSSVWSGTQSFHFSSPDFSDGEALSPEPCVNMDSLRYSPICDFSGDESISKVNCEKSNAEVQKNDSIAESSETKDLVGQTRFKRRKSRANRDYKRSCSEPRFTEAGSPSKMEKKPFEVDEAPPNSIGEYILVLLSHLSQTDKFTHFMATKPCLQSILDFLTLLPYITKRAERILLRVIRRYDLFESTVGFGLVHMVIGSIKPIHIASSCSTCNRLQNLKRNLLTNLSLVAESRFGIGELLHMLLRAADEELAQCFLSIPYIVKQQQLLQKLLDQSTLEKMLRLLVNKPELLSPTISSITELCRPWTEDFVSLPSHNKQQCLYDPKNSDVHFKLEDGSKYPARRSQLSQNSEYFRAMFDGHFMESKQEELTLPFVSRVVGELVVHHLYGCVVSRCHRFAESSLENLTELMEASDRLLLQELARQLVVKINTSLNPENICKVYACGNKLGNSEICLAAVNYLLLGQYKEERMRGHFEEFFKSDVLRDNFIQDVALTIRQRIMSDSTDYPKTNVAENIVS